MIDPGPIRERFAVLSPHLDERERRLLAAVEARACGYGGIAAVSLATGMAASTIGRGLKELAGETAVAPGRVRCTGGGRRPLLVTDPELLAELMVLVDPGERGDPMSPLRWTCKSLRQLATRAPGQPHCRRRIVEAAEVQPSRQQQDPRGRRSSRPERAVHSHQSKCDGSGGGAAAGHFC